MFVPMKRLINILRNHPKKFIFLTGITSFAAVYLNDKYKLDVQRRRFCDHVKPLGNVNVAPHDRLRHLTVYLNPFARRGNLLKDFEKNIAPLLQLSGLDVKMVYTDSDMEIKDSVFSLDLSSTDGVLIASDDHVLQKAVTALLQRTDLQNSKLRKLPFGIAPVGVWNTFARGFSTYENDLQQCFNLMLPLLKNSAKSHNVLEISSIPPLVSKSSSDSDDNTSSSRRTYSLIGLEWSVWRDVEHGGGAGAPKRKFKPIDTNEHRGILQPFSLLSPGTWTKHFGVIWRFFSFWFVSTPNTPVPSKLVTDGSFFQVNDPIHPPNRRLRTKVATIVYTPACEGCSRCWKSRLQELSTDLQKDPPKTSTSTFGRLFGLSPLRVRNPELDHDSATLKSLNQELQARSTIVNESCGEERTLVLDKLIGLVLALDGNHIRLHIQPESPGILQEFLRFRSRLMEVPYRHDPNTTDTNSNESSEITLYCSAVRIYPAITENEYFWIDNDHFEACPVDIRIRHNAVNLFQ